MKMISKIATASAVAAVGLGLGAAGASANVTVTGGAFSGSQTSPNVFSASGLSVECATATFAGNTANASTNVIPFHADYSGCSIDLAGIPFDALVTTNSDWRLNYVSGTPGTGVTASVQVLAPGSGPAVEIEIPDLACSIDIGAQSGLSSVAAANVSSPTAVDISASVSGIAYTSDCFGVDPSGTDGAYNGDVRIPGITMV